MNMPIISSMIQIYTAILSPWNRRKQMMFANIACKILWVAIKMRSIFFVLMGRWSTWGTNFYLHET